MESKINNIINQIKVWLLQITWNINITKKYHYNINSPINIKLISTLTFKHKKYPLEYNYLIEDKILIKENINFIIIDNFNNVKIRLKNELYTYTTPLPSDKFVFNNEIIDI